jgi:colanic acid/amylovoran biosynthesis glycosyltransferase
MKIAHFVPHFSELTETFIYDLIRGLGEAGAGGAVLTRRRVNAEARPHGEVVVLRDGLLEKGRRALALGRPAALLERDVYGLEAALERTRPDVLWAHFGLSGALAAHACARAKVPLVVSFQGKDIYSASEGMKAAYRDLASRARRIVAASRDIEAALLKAGLPRERVEVIYNGVRLSGLPYADPAGRFDGRTVRFLQVGRFVAKKDPLATLEAFARARALAGSPLDLELTIVGGGKLLDEARRRLDSLGLEACVKLPGPLPHDEVRALLARSHVYVQASREDPSGDREGLGVSFTEASACGLPIIGMRSGGVPEIVRDGETGLLVREGDWAAMGEAMARLAAEPRRWTELGAAGRALVESSFTVERQLDAALRVARQARA